MIFWNFCLRKYFFFLCWTWIIDVSEQYCEHFRKIEQVELVENLPLSYLPYQFLHNLLSFLLWEKVKIIDFLSKVMTRIIFLCIGSYDKWFCIKSWLQFANLLLLSKASSKKQLSERCRKHSSYHTYPINWTILFVYKECGHLNRFFRSIHINSCKF